MTDRASVGIMTVHQLEKEGTQPRRATLDVIRRALEAAGVEFIDENGGGPGVRFAKIDRGQTEKEVTAAAARPLSTS